MKSLRKKAEEVLAIAKLNKKKPRGKPFAPGNKIGFASHPEHINAGGKPKNFQRMDTILTAQLLEPATKTDVQDAGLPTRKEPYTRVEVLVAVLQKAAIKGDLAAIRMCRDMYDSLTHRVASAAAGTQQVQVNVGVQSVQPTGPLAITRPDLLERAQRSGDRIRVYVEDLQTRLHAAEVELRERDLQIAKLNTLLPEFKTVNAHM